eukprot:3082460-Pleurochrysis_carterae.AAC.1
MAFRSAPPTSGIVYVMMIPQLQFIQYRMRTIYKCLRHKNRRYGGAASVALRRLASGACGQLEAPCGRLGAGIQRNCAGAAILDKALLDERPASLAMGPDL